MVNVKNMILKPMLNMLVSAYRQGRDDFNKGDYNEDNFKSETERLIAKQF